MSYYRRVAGTADTLMQMGRWFGFRPGYQDLVRVFLGVKEGRQGQSDLVSLFKEVCRMEERFRDELKRYVRRPGGHRITPREIPPMISVSGSLPPTASNKMFNAILAKKNFGGERSMLTLAPVKADSMDRNIHTVKALLRSAKSLGTERLGGLSSENKAVQFNAIILEASNGGLVEFLKDYRWLETDYKFPGRPTDVGLQIEFLEQQKHGIQGWLIVAPQRQVSFGDPLLVEGLGKFAVKERHRNEGRGMQVYGEPDHRTVSEFLAGIAPGSSKLTQPNSSTGSLRNVHRGVILLYPVREQEKDGITIGYELLFPNNDLPYEINFSVRQGGKSQIVVQRVAAP